jgi:putative transposase
MSETDRLDGATEWIDLFFVERERTPRRFFEEAIRLHLGGLSLSSTVSELATKGIERSRTAVHNWVQKAGLQPDSDVEPTEIALDETMIQLNTDRYWLFAADDPEMNHLLHVRLFQVQTIERTMLFLRELRADYDLDDVTFLIDDARYLISALRRLGIDFLVVRHGHRNSVERVFKEVKRRTSSFSNTFSYVHPATAETWLQAHAVWWNHA